MINSKTLIKLARKWQRLAILKRKRISFPKAAEEEESCSNSSRVDKKGHFVVYSTDEKRFTIPLTYLKSRIFVKLLDMAFEELGLPGDGPITLPWDANFMEYALSLIQRRVGEDLQKAFILSMATSHCLSSSQLLEDHTRHHPSICSF